MQARLPLQSTPRQCLIALGLAIGLMATIYAYATPILFSPILAGGSAGAFFNDWPRAFTFSFALSCAHAAASTCLSLMLGFAAALSLLRKRVLARFLPLLIIPVLLGSSSYAFLLRRSMEVVLFQPQSFRERSLWVTFIVLITSSCLQFVPLVTFVFWSQFRSISRERRDLLQGARASAGEEVRDLYWPEVRNQFGLCALLVFAITASEYSIPHLLLKAAPGQGNETLAITIARYYHAVSQVDPLLARQGVLLVSLASGITGALLAWLTMLAVFNVSGLMVGGLPRIELISSRPFKLLYRYSLLFLLLLPFLPLLAVLWPLPKMLVSTNEVLRQVRVTLLMALACTVLAIIIGILARSGLPEILSNLNSRSARIFSLLFLLLLLPPTGIALTTHWWLTQLGTTSDSPWFRVLWGFAEATAALPLIVSFVLLTHFGVSRGELEFLRFSRGSLREIAWISFLRRFRASYTLLGLFSFALLWHEGTINAVLGTVGGAGESFAVLLEGRLDGRGGNFSEGNGLILTSLVILTAGCLVWPILAARERLRNS